MHEVSYNYKDFRYIHDIYSIIPKGKALARLLKDDRVRDTPHGREYKCKDCDYWLPWDTEFYSPRKDRGEISMSKICRVCKKIKTGRLSGA